MSANALPPISSIPHAAIRVMNQVAGLWFSGKP
jgi:hypothetical protein